MKAITARLDELQWLIGEGVDLNRVIPGSIRYDGTGVLVWRTDTRTRTKVVSELWPGEIYA
jgi:hypothetical protein